MTLIPVTETLGAVTKMITVACYKGRQHYSITAIFDTVPSFDRVIIADVMLFFAHHQTSRVREKS